jgi:hypothetical protein
MGLVSQVFNEENLHYLQGDLAIGHTRYSTTGAPRLRNTQPYVIETLDGPLALGHNGNLINAPQLRRELLERGTGLSTSSDSEVILHLLAGAGGPDMMTRIRIMMARAEGAYALVILTRNGIYGVRDPWGLRPLVLGKIDGGYVLASDNNTLEFIYAAYTPAGDRVKIPDFFGIPTFIVQFDSLEFSYLQGFWANQRYSLIRDTIEIDINQTNLVGDVQIVNPKVTMRIANSWGFPTRGVIKYLSFIGQDGQEIPLESTVFVDSAVDFNYPKYALNEIGQTKYTDITLDSTNSNIAEIFNSQPTRLIYEVDGISNAENDPTIVGFLTDSSLISLSMRVELLLEGSAKNFGAEQTIDLNFGNLTDLDTSQVESVEFKLVGENGLPISSNLQLYFLDEAGVAIDSLFSDGAQDVIQSAPVNAEGVATGETRTEHFIPMSATRFERVRQAKKAFLTTSFTTAQNGTVPVKLLATNNLTLKMGIKARTKY